MNEWYTPSKYIEAAREVMGSIDLDPASCELANRTVKATTFYTVEDNGLNKEWYGNVWLNPPYDNPLPWIQKICKEEETIQQAILLANAYTDTSWFNILWNYLLCFNCGRIKFYRNGEIQTHWNARHGSVFVYVGPNEQKFIEVFSQFGTIVKRVEA